VDIVLAQDTRGIKPIRSQANVSTGTTRAVVIGISDYLDPNISDLKYAHRDAQIFARFLLSPHGAELKKENVVLLTNEEATGGKIMSAMNWLLESSTEGDLAIIYFAGHGDVETKLYQQPGYLLVWDSPGRSYFLNALGINELQSFVNTLSFQNKSKVILITDACHSGSLAGSIIQGSQATVKNMMDMFRNQLLILSCQPDELSIEGEEWDGGRGLFSYYLVDGLIGLANTNRDSLITVLEMERYLQDNVSRDAKKFDQIQTPMIQGNVNEVMTYVGQEVPTHPNKVRDYELPALNPVRSRFYEENYFNEKDTSLLALYKKFQSAIERKEFLAASANNLSADELYQQIEKKLQSGSLLNYIKHNYAAALQDDAQATLLSIINPDYRNITRSKIAKTGLYKKYPEYLERAASLLGQNHFMFKSIKARQFFFEGLLMLFEISSSKNIVEGNAIMSKFRNSLNLEPQGPHTYFYMMLTMATKFANRDSAVYFAYEASRCATGWSLPFAYLSFFYASKFKNQDSAKLYLDKAMRLDTSDMIILSTQAAWHFNNKDFDIAHKIYRRMLKRDSMDATSWLNLGICFLQLNSHFESEEALLKSYYLDSTEYLAAHYLGVLNVRTGKNYYAENWFKKAIKINNKFVTGRRELARLFRQQMRNDEAEILFREILLIDSKHLVSYYELACISSLKNQPDKCLEFLEQLFENGYSDFDKIMKDEKIANVTNLKEFKAMIAKYRN
jgi:Tfp pilus assembly protein PilF